MGERGAADGTSAAGQASWRAAAGRVITALAGPDARLRPDQLEAIAALQRPGARVLVVQATGWGKSAVYWCATAARRLAGAGPTLVVSPLLALMRDQVAAAGRAGLRAVTINSANAGQWARIEDQLAAGEADVLLVSPERLADPVFGRRVLDSLAGRMGLLVIDEAHAISDWGHDFRPDYRRVTEVLARLDPGVPVLATTATANARVTADVAAQLGEAATVLRGPLGRDSLQLAVTGALTPLERHAWVAAHLPALPGSGIVYALTIAEAERATAAIRAVNGAGYPVATYTGRLEAAERERLEDALARNEVKALVATSALGMGYDKPDLGFVVHLGAPPSPVSYYQQAGRAGRGIGHALVVLLPSPSDERIWRYFATATLPDERLARRVLAALAPAAPAPGPGGESGEGSQRSPARAGGNAPPPPVGEAMPVVALEAATGLRRGRVELLLKQLAVDKAVARVPGGWVATGREWHYDAAHYAGIVAVREREMAIMADYVAGRGCLMELLRRSLDDEAAAPCGRCSVCLKGLPAPLRPAPSGQAVAAVTAALRGAVHVLEPRKMWPGGVFGRRGRIAAAEAADPGRVLIEMDAPEWQAVAGACLDAPGDAPGELLDALVGLMRAWSRDWAQRPGMVVAFPVLATPAGPYPVAGQVAGYLARVGRLDRADWIPGADPGPPAGAPESAEGTPQRLAGAVEAARWQARIGAAPPGVAGRCVLLVSDVTASGWPVTLAAAALRRAGASRVLPLVLRRVP